MSVVRLTAAELVAAGVAPGVALQAAEETVGTRTLRSEVVRLAPGARLSVSVDLGYQPGAPLYLGVSRYIPAELQAVPAMFAIFQGGAPVYEAYGVVEGMGGPFETLIVPISWPERADRPDDPGLPEHESAAFEIVNTGDQPLYVWEVLLFEEAPADTAMDLFYLVGGLGNRQQMERSIAAIPVKSAPGEGSTVGIAVNWPFLGSLHDGSRPSEEPDLIEGFRRAESIAAAHGFTKVNVKLTSDWGGWPIWVSDGRGGRFGDLEYQQIVYSPNHVRETPQLRELLGDSYAREYGLTTPNRWSNTPWLTYNHPRLNAFLGQQYSRVAAIYDRVLEERILAGEAIPFAPISTGTESLYWVREGNRGMDDFVYTEYNDGINRDPLTGDFNPYTVEAARRDGVELDPTDGLDRRERDWLHHNLARYTQMLVDAMYGAQGGSILRVTDDGNLQPVVAPRHQIYTEPYGYRFYPYWDVTRPMMQVGVVRGARPGAQWYTTDFVPYLRRQRELGKTANPNFEWTGIAGEDDAVSSLRAAYAFGVEFVTLYNWTGDVDRAKRVLERYGREFPVAFGFSGQLRATESGVYRQAFRPRGDLHVLNVLDVKAGELPASPVVVTLSRRVFLSEEPVVSFAVPPAHAQLLEDGFVRLRLPEMWLPTDSNYVVQVAAGAWPLADAVEVRLGLDLVRARGHSRLIQARGEALRLLDLLDPVHELDHAERGGEIAWQGRGPVAWVEEAKALLAQGEFAKAVEAMLIADGLRLPARFLLEPGQSFVFPWGATLTAAARTLLTIFEVHETESGVEARLSLRQAGEGADGLRYNVDFPGGSVRTEEASGVIVLGFDMEQ